MKTKIESLKISNNFTSGWKEKMNTSFDEAIKKMSEEIVKGTNISNKKDEGAKKKIKA